MKKLWCLSVLVCLAVVNSASTTLAAVPQFFRKGNAYSTVLGEEDRGKEVMVYATSTRFNRQTGRGLENIRVFSRSYNAKWDHWSRVRGINRVKLRFRATTGIPNPLDLDIVDSTPASGPDNGCANHFFASLFADIIGYAGFPNNTVAYITAELLQCGSVQFYSESNQSFDKTVELAAGTWSTIAPLADTDLPESVLYEDADPNNDNTPRGIAAWFNFLLEPEATNYRVDAIATIVYQYEPLDGRWPFTRASGTSGYPHTINTP